MRMGHASPSCHQCTQYRRPSVPPPQSTRSAGPQFASTPRFLFSQTQRPHHDNDANESELASTALRTDRKPQVGSTARQREVIDDATDDEREPDTARPARDGIFDYSSPPDAGTEAEAAGDVDSEFEDLLALPTERAKRRRVSVETATATATTTPSRPRDDATILTSSPEPQQWNEPPVTPFSRRRRPQDQNAATNGTPKPTPAPASAKPFRHHPRFMLSASQQVPSSQARAPLTPASQTPTSTSTSRRKPAFVLPRSPSPSREDEDTASLPTPFSPSSRTLNRRGRARSNAPGYVPGGMASEVRSWVLEMGTKREQLQPSPGRQMFSTETKKYLITARITNIRRSALGSSGPLAFVEAQVQQQSAEAEAGESRRSILLMGSPRFRPGYHELRVDDVIGVYRGLVWEIELNQDGMDDLLRRSPNPADLTGCTNGDDSEKWLVAMEWDLLQ